MSVWGSMPLRSMRPVSLLSEAYPIVAVPDKIQQLKPQCDRERETVLGVRIGLQNLLYCRVRDQYAHINTNTSKHTQMYTRHIYHIPVTKKTMRSKTTNKLSARMANIESISSMYPDARQACTCVCVCVWM